MAERDHAAVGLHQHQPIGEAALLQLRVEPVEVLRGLRADEGVDHRGHRPLVLADRL